MNIHLRLRERLINGLDWIRFRLETTRYFFDSPKLDYQPSPWLGIDNAEIRGDSTVQRWHEILRYVRGTPELSTALDIGCCYGYFSINLACEGLEVVGVDLNSRSLGIARRSPRQAKADRCSFLEMRTNPDNVVLLPHAELVICLAVWHHWVKHYGIDSASVMLRAVWARTGKILFFESGEDEDTEEFDLPFGDTPPREWLHQYLTNLCVDGQVSVAGVFPAGEYPKYGDAGATRAMFVIERKS